MRNVQEQRDLKQGFCVQLETQRKVDTVVFAV